MDSLAFQMTVPRHPIVSGIVAAAAFTGGAIIPIAGRSETLGLPSDFNDLLLRPTMGQGGNYGFTQTVLPHPSFGQHPAKAEVSGQSLPPVALAKVALTKVSGEVPQGLSASARVSLPHYAVRVELPPVQPLVAASRSLEAGSSLSGKVSSALPLPEASVAAIPANPLQPEAKTSAHFAASRAIAPKPALGIGSHAKVDEAVRASIADLRLQDTSVRSFSLASLPASRVVDYRPSATPLIDKTIERSARTRDRMSGDYVLHDMAFRIGDQAGGSITVRIGADLQPAVKLGDLLARVSNDMDPDLHARLSASSSTDSYVSLADLRKAGFDVAYNPSGDSLKISASSQSE